MSNASSYSPMIYDAMRESANRLAGEYAYLANRTKDAVMRNALLDAIKGVRSEAAMTDPNNMTTVEEKTAEFDERAANMRAWRVNSSHTTHDRTTIADTAAAPAPTHRLRE